MNRAKRIIQSVNFIYHLSYLQLVPFKLCESTCCWIAVGFKGEADPSEAVERCREGECKSA